MNIEELPIFARTEHYAKNEYAVTNMIQSLSNAAIYCSYFEDSDLGFELKEMIERFKERVERKINENF